MPEAGKLEANADEIIKDYLSGFELPQVSHKYKADVRSVRRFLIRHDITVRSKYSNRAGMLAGKDEEIIELYKNGMCLEDVSELYKCSIPAIRLLLVRNGFERRSIEIATRRYDLNTSYFDKIDTEEKAYFLGWLWTDGHNQENVSTVSLELQERDKCILEMFGKSVDANYPIRSRKRITKNGKETTMVRLDLCSKTFSQTLSRYGMVSHKTYSIGFPFEIVPSSLYPHFIRGCFDGDGSYGFYPDANKKFSCVMYGQNPLLLGMQKILLDNGVITYFIPSKGKNKPCATLTISKQSSFCEFVDYVFKNYTICLERKREKVLNILSWIGERPFTSPT